ncbi:MAG: class I SAM-dependent methyltransferase [Sulfitobacter sp.]
MPDQTPDLNAAYALETPEDNRTPYESWAQTYDAGFASDMDYRLPQLVALVLAEVMQGTGPVLDVGAGTGLVAAHFPLRSVALMDALDISPDMLDVARGKGLYRACIIGDLTGGLQIADGAYGAIVSSGTFTHGHVGPDALNELLRVGRSGAVFVLSINSEHFEARGFAAKFAELEAHIDGLEHRMVNIYGQATDAAYKDDQAHIVIFHKR